MKLKSISATALGNFIECPSRFVAENVLYVPRTGDSTRADLGSVCHDAIKNYIIAVWVKKTDEGSLNLLLKFLLEAMPKYFRETNPNYASLFKEAKMMLDRWYERNDFSAVEILSTEVKNSVDFKTIEGIVPLRFIYDLAVKWEDEIGTVIRVHDWKSSMIPITEEELPHNLQARIYALCAQLFYKHLNPYKIIVVMDMLRYGQPQHEFTIEDNRATWKLLRDVTTQVLQMDQDRAPERLNAGCVWCVRKTTCKTLQKNAAGGGIESMSLDEKLESYLALQGAAKGIDAALKELESHFVRQAEETEDGEFDTDRFAVVMKSKSSPKVDSARIRAALPPEEAAPIGSMTVTEARALADREDLPEETRSIIRSSITREYGKPKPKVIRKLVEDERVEL